MATLGSPARASIPEDPVAQGTRLWEARYDGAADHLDHAIDMAVSPDGQTIFVTGFSLRSGTSVDATTIAYSQSGTVLWRSHFTSTGAAIDYTTAVAVSPNGQTVYVTGQRAAGTTNDYLTIAYTAASGAQQWAAFYNGPGNGSDSATDVAVSPDGTQILVTGESRGTTSNADYATIAYSAGSGSQQWVARYNGPANGRDGATALVVASGGSRIIVTGSSAGTGLFSSDFATVSYNSAGSQLWATRYSGPSAISMDYPTDMALLPDGTRVIVTGSVSDGSYADYATIAYSSATGSQLWAATYNGPGSVYDNASSIAISPDSSTAYVTGGSASATNTDVATVAYDSGSGAQRWLARYNGPNNGSDFANDIAVSPDGSRIIVTGSTAEANGIDNDSVTLAYRQNGALSWAARHNAGSQDFANAVKISPNGSTAYVTGISTPANGLSDWMTAAYRLTDCENGRDETGTASAPIDDTIEPQLGPARAVGHGVNCDVVVATAGL